MSKLTEILQRVREDHPRLPLLVELVESVTNLKADTAAYLTLPILQRLASKYKLVTDGGISGEAITIGFLGNLTALAPPSMTEIFRWAEYLASERIGFLQRHFELLREDGGTEPLANELVAAAFDSGELIDPEHGVAIDNWRDSVILYYSIAQGVDDEEIVVKVRK